MTSKQSGVDVAAYQSSSLAKYYNAGAKFVIIKLTEGTGYFNPVASAQIKSAHAHHMYVHGYHFATFGSSVSQAKKEANTVLNVSKDLALVKNVILLVIGKLVMETMFMAVKKQVLKPSLPL